MSKLPILTIEEALQPVSLDARGRGQPKCEARSDALGVTLRIEDNANDETWIEIRLERHDLFDFIRRAMTIQQNGGF